MTTLRKLSVIYLLCASWFSVAIAFDRDPPLERASRATARVALAALDRYVVKPSIQVARDGGNRVIAALYPPSPPARQVASRPSPATRQARFATPPPTPPSVKIPDVQVAVELRRPNITVTAPRHQPKPVIALVPPSSLPPSPAATLRESLSPAELVRVSMRLKENLTREMLENFGLFLYVSKADRGPWAQRLYVFHKDASGGLSMLYNWPASTGREKYEIDPNGSPQHTITPRGYFELDPSRMYRNHFSGEWHEPMPYAMFFNWENHGYQTGLAIHGAAGLEVSQLGARASAGCIRISPENAELLFGLIRSEYKGLAPRFAFDRRTATMSNDGVLMHDPAGNLQMAEGYKVLVFIENYGGENVVAALF